MANVLTRLNSFSGYLFFSILFAFVIRAIFLWWTRPDFVGWFNHSYYYWLQTRSFLTDGTLAYPDMPLLFWLYSGLAAFLQLFMSSDSAIINGTRVLMSVIPAIMPLVCYWLFISISPESGKKLSTKLLVLSSGILPLTVIHMPELLQKNMLGIVSLLFTLYAIHEWLKLKTMAWFIAIVVLTSAVTLAHLGSALACMLLLIAWYVVAILQSTNRIQLFGFTVVVLLSVFLIFFYLYLLNPSVETRVLLVVTDIRAISAIEWLATLLVLGLMIGLVIMAWRSFDKHSHQIPVSLTLLSKICSIWVLLLLLPFWPGEMANRLLLFLPLPVLILLYSLTFIPIRYNISFILTIVWTTVCMAMTIGEIVSLSLTEKNKMAVHQELVQLNEKYQFTNQDMIISPYATHTLTSWLFHTKGSMITAIEEDALAKYQRVFVINTLQRPAPELLAGEVRIISTEYQAYQTSRHDIPMPDELLADGAYTQFDVFQIEQLPENWIFNEQHQWSGWRNNRPE